MNNVNLFVALVFYGLLWCWGGVKFSTYKEIYEYYNRYVLWLTIDLHVYEQIEINN